MTMGNRNNESGRFLAVIIAGLWAFQSYCNAQMLSLPPFDGDLLKSEDILNLDSIFERKCNDWSQVPEIKKVKVYDYIDKSGNKQNFIRAIFGNIEYCIDRWVFEDETGSEETDTDEPEIYCDYEYISTFDPKFEYLGYRVGQYCNIDSTLSPATPVKGTDYYQIAPIPNSWRIVVRNDTVRKIYLAPPNYSKDSPRLMIDNVMMANWNHIPTMPAYEKYLSQDKLRKEKYEAKIALDSAGLAVKIILQEQFDLSPVGGYAIMFFPVSGSDESSDIPIKEHDYADSQNDTINLNMLARNMPKYIADVEEIQNISERRIHAFVDVNRGKAISKPYIVATLNGIEYLLLLDYLPERDVVYVSCVMTYDPDFELNGLKISGDSPSYFLESSHNFYDLTEFSIFRPWHCVAKDNKIIYFYKYVWLPAPHRIEDMIQTANIYDEIMLTQSKPQYKAKVN